MIIAGNVHDKVLNHQKRLLKRKIWFATLRHKSSMMISKGKNDLLSDTIEWLKNKGFKVSYLPSMHIPHVGLVSAIWTVSWN